GFGIAAGLCPRAQSNAGTGFLCFHHFTAGDLVVGSAKVVGSAQRKRRGALLQHGGILLEQSPFTPTLPGLAELTGKRIEVNALQTAIVECLAARTGAHLTAADWTDAEKTSINDLIIAKYSTHFWNGKR